MFAQIVPLVSFSRRGGPPMNLHNRAVRSNCWSSRATSNKAGLTAPYGISSVEHRNRSGRPQRRRLRPRDLLLTTTATSVTAGTIYWRSTRSLPMSLGVVLLIALTGVAVAWLYAREETRQVEARENGATAREWIRHCAEIQLAEAQNALIKATTCGPSSSPDDAQALRLDACRALELSPPTAVKDAMRITRVADTNGQRNPPRGGSSSSPRGALPTTWQPSGSNSTVRQDA
jgi:hypothetical protein